MDVTCPSCSSTFTVDDAPPDPAAIDAAAAGQVAVIEAQAAAQVTVTEAQTAAQLELMTAADQLEADREARQLEQLEEAAEEAAEHHEEAGHEEGSELMPDQPHPRSEHWYTAPLFGRGR